MLLARMPRYMREDDLRVRPLRISDAGPLGGWLQENGIFGPAPGPAPLARLLTWWWTRRRFTVSFCIEAASRPVGFIGFYAMRLGDSAEITLVIFDRTMRRRGYGSRAFRLVERNLRRHSVVKRIRARVRPDDRAALAFWRGLGFDDEEEECTGDAKCLSLDLSAAALPPPSERPSSCSSGHPLPG